MGKLTRAKVIRMARGESQEMAGVALGVTSRTVSRFEAGEMRIDSMRVGFVSKAERYYGLPVAELVQEFAA